MKLFGRTSGYYIFWTGCVYFLAEMFNSLVYKFTQAEFIQYVWIFALMLPLVVRPIGHYFNMRTIWE